MRSLAKFLFVPVILVLSALGARQILGTPPLDGDPTKSVIMPPKITRGLVSTNAPGANAIKPALTAHATMHSVSAEVVQDHAVHVKAAAELFDAAGGSSYIWAVRAYSVTDKAKTTLWSRRYDEQIFTIKPGGTESPTFDDVLDVPLPAGDYAIEVAVYKEAPHVGAMKVIKGAATIEF